MKILKPEADGSPESDDARRIFEDMAVKALKYGTKAAISLLPYGGAANQIFDWICAYHSEQTTTFLNLGLKEAAEALAAAGMPVDSLEQNDTFHRTATAATRSAAQSKSEEKRQRLRFAMTNAALEPARWADDEPRLLRLLETSSENHMLLLDRIENRRQFPLFVRRLRYTDEESIRGSDPSALALADLNYLFSEGLIGKRGREPFQMRRPNKADMETLEGFRDYIERSFPETRENPSQVTSRELECFVHDSGHVVDGCKLTDLGREFLAFISGPELGTADPAEGAE